MDISECSPDIPKIGVVLKAAFSTSKNCNILLDKVAAAHKEKGGYL
jgi:hypothetical protein